MAKLNPIQAEKLLKGMKYPAKKQDIVQYAQQHGADQTAREVLDKLPDREYEGPTGVSEALGQINREEDRSS